MIEHIKCPRCGSVSHHPEDVKNGYCGRCHWWTSDPNLAPFHPGTYGEQPCPFCGEDVLPDDEKGQVIHTPEGPRHPHHECMFREVYGGIGHHADHERWCVQESDPDMGLGYRESARRSLALFLSGQ